MSPREHLESRVDRRARSRTLAGFFAAGAGLSTLVLLLPGWDALYVPGIVATIVAAASGAGLLLLLADRIGKGIVHALTVFGTVLIAACQLFAGGGSATAMYAMLYVWVALHCALFFSHRAVVGHVLLATVAHATVLVLLDDLASIAPQLTLTLGTQGVAALVVGGLARQQRALADSDALTGLGNRRVAERVLGWSLARSSREPSSTTCVAVLDLDGFKAFNDAQGHAAGDHVLRSLAAAWSDVVRETDTLARTGGDEFLLVLPSCDLDGAAAIVARMVASTPAGVACSAGVARWDGRESPLGLIARADRALYDAKREGPVVLASESADGTPVPAR